MDDLRRYSGPWTGLSTQRRRRLTEAIRLHIGDSVLSGEGSDVDGAFSLVGEFDAASGEVHLVRQYTVTALGDPLHMEAKFDYFGRWDGQMVSGTWLERGAAANNGTFEMWPDREEDRQERRIQFEEMVGAGP